MTKIKSKNKKMETFSIQKVLSTRYYWCVNCGYTGDFGMVIARGLSCKGCGYDIFVDYSKAEYEIKLERNRLGGFIG